MTTRERNGFTLLEILVSLAILAVLFGIGFALTGSARERGRRADCMSKLHQIGVAIAMYRQDYHGAEYGSFARMGLPPSFFELLPPRLGGGGYITDERVIVCSRAAALPREARGGLGPGFAYEIWPEVFPELNAPPFSRVVAQRRQDYPLVVDNWHSDARRDRPPGDNGQFRMILRLDGRVTSGWTTWRVGEWNL